MPRFYFDVIAEGELYPDGDGLDLDALAEARAHALRLIARMLREAADAWDCRHWSVTVAGPDGTALVHIPFPDVRKPGEKEDAPATPRVAVRKPAVL